MKRILKSFRKKSGKSKKGIPLDEQQQMADSMAELNAFYEEETGVVESQGAVETTTGTTASGRRVTTTTVRVPPTGETSGAKTSASEEEEAASTTTDLTRNLVKKFIADIWNRGEVDLIPDVCSPSLRFNGNTGFDRVGHDGLARMVSTIRDALEDYHCEIHSMVVEHNKAFCRLRFTGKHTGNLLGYEPTGRVVAWMGATEFTCQNGKILKVWELGDVKSLEEQLTSDDTDTAREV